MSRALCLLAGLLLFLSASIFTSAAIMVSMDADDQRETAAHEAGHAVLYWHFSEYHVTEVRVMTSDESDIAGYTEREEPLMPTMSSTWHKCVAVAAGAESQMAFGGRHRRLGSEDDEAKLYRIAFLLSMNILRGVRIDPSPPLSRITGDMTLQEIVGLCRNEAHREALARESEIRKLVMALENKPRLNHAELVGVLGPSAFLTPGT